MSIATWKAEFYQTKAEDTAVDEAVAHSLQKWRGLIAENLERHGVQRASFGSIEDATDRFSINTETCALCCHHWEEDDDMDEGHSCGDCPLAAARDGVSCDDNRVGERLSPYQVWVDHGNPAPMILWLEKAQQLPKPDDSK